MNPTGTPFRLDRSRNATVQVFEHLRAYRAPGARAGHSAGAPRVVRVQQIESER